MIIDASDRRSRGRTSTGIPARAIHAPPRSNIFTQSNRSGCSNRPARAGQASRNRWAALAATLVAGSSLRSSELRRHFAALACRATSRSFTLGHVQDRKDWTNSVGRAESGPSGGRYCTNTSDLPMTASRGSCEVQTMAAHLAVCFARSKATASGFRASFGANSQLTLDNHPEETRHPQFERCRASVENSRK